MKKIILACLMLLSIATFGQTPSKAELEKRAKAKQDAIRNEDTRANKDADASKTADQELNSTYQQILKEYAADTSFISHLKIAQRLWIKFRDAELLMKYPPQTAGYYGSEQPMCEKTYLDQLTRDRIKTLKIWLDGIAEGDVCSGSVKMKH